MSKENIKKEIDSLKEQIEVVEKRNSDNGNLSFLYWQLHELEKELKDMEGK